MRSAELGPGSCFAGEGRSPKRRGPAWDCRSWVVGKDLTDCHISWSAIMSSVRKPVRNIGAERPVLFGRF